MLKHRESTLQPTLAALLFAGLFEGLAIARYDVLMADFTGTAPLWATASVFLVMLTHLIGWGSIAWILRRSGVRDRWVLWAATAAVAAAVALYARLAIDDRTVLSPLVAVGPLALYLLFAITRLWRLHSANRSPPTHIEPSRREAVTNAILVALAWLPVAVWSLFGRVPDVPFPLGTQVSFAASNALIAMMIVAAVFWWARAAVLGAGLLVLGSLLAMVAPRTHADPGRPNVLFVLVDTLRQDYTAPFGDAVRGQAIKDLAERGVTFSRTLTAIPKTPASVASFFTARYPPGHGVRTLFDALPEVNNTIAEEFQSAGYRTEAFVANAWISRGRSFGQGFDRFHGWQELNRPWGPLRYVSWWMAFDRLSMQRIEPFSGQTYAHSLTDRVLAALDDGDRDPFFHYVHYFEPHWPYLPPPELARRYGADPERPSKVNNVGSGDLARAVMLFDNPLPEDENEHARKLYRGEVDNTLAAVGRLLEGLEERGLTDDTIVVFTADHGHSLGQHRYWFHHGAFLYDDSALIPLVLSWPGSIPEGRNVDFQVRSVDVMPTLVELALDRAPRQPVTGESLAPLWKGTESEHREAFLESDVKMMVTNTRRAVPGTVGKLRAVSDGRWKLVMTPLAPGFFFELFDVQEDSAELTNLAQVPEHRATFERLSEALQRLIPEAERDALDLLQRQTNRPADPSSSAPGPGGEGQEDPIDESERRLLESLGYVEGGA